MYVDALVVLVSLYVWCCTNMMMMMFVVNMATMIIVIMVCYLYVSKFV